MRRWISFFLIAGVLLGPQSDPMAQTTVGHRTLHGLLVDIAIRAPYQDFDLFEPILISFFGVHTLPAFRWRATSGDVGNVLAFEEMPFALPQSPEGWQVLQLGPPSRFEIGSYAPIRPGALLSHDNRVVHPNASWQPTVARIEIDPDAAALMAIDIHARDIALPRDAFAPMRAESARIALGSVANGDSRYDQKFRVSAAGLIATDAFMQLSFDRVDAWIGLDDMRLDTFFDWAGLLAGLGGDTWQIEMARLPLETSMIAAVAGDEAAVAGISHGLHVAGAHTDIAGLSIDLDSFSLAFAVGGLREMLPAVEIRASVDGLEVHGETDVIDADLVPDRIAIDFLIEGLALEDYARTVAVTLGAWADVPTPEDAVSLAFAPLFWFSGRDGPTGEAGPVHFTFRRIFFDSEALWLDLSGAMRRSAGETGVALDLDFVLAADERATRALAALYPPAAQDEAAVQMLLDLGVPAGEAADGRALRHYHLVVDGEGTVAINGTDIAPLLGGP